MTLSNRNNSSSSGSDGAMRPSNQSAAPVINSGLAVGSMPGGRQPKKKSAPPTPKELLTLYDELYKKLRAYAKNTPLGSDGDEETSKAPDDSFSSENLKKLRDLSASKTAVPLMPSVTPAPEQNSLKTALISAQHVKPDPEAELPSGAELLKKEVNIEDILRGVSSERQLDKTQVILNETAARQRIDLSGSVDRNTSWARQTLKQEALPYTLRSAAKKKEEEEEQTGSQTYIPKVAPRKTFSKPGTFTPLASTPLQNPNAAPQLQTTSSKLIMNQLNKSPFREVSRKEARAQAQEERKSVFASTFTPKAGQIPAISSINEDADTSSTAAGPTTATSDAANSATNTSTSAANDTSQAPLSQPPQLGSSISAPRPNPLPPLVGKPILPQGSTPLMNMPGGLTTTQAFRKPDSTFALGSTPKLASASQTRPNITEETLPVDSSVPMAKIRLELALNFGGRPANSRIPIYSPILDYLYQPRLKRQIGRSSTPIKMALTDIPTSSESSSSNKLSSMSFNPLAGKTMRSGMLKLSQACDYYTTNEEEDVSFNESAAKRLKGLAAKYPLHLSLSANDYGNEALALIDIGWSGRRILNTKAPIRMEGMRTKYISASNRRYGASNAAERPAISDLFQQLCASLVSSQNAEENGINGAILMVRLGGKAAYDHLVRTAELGEKIAAELKIDDIRTRRQIEYGSMFKDIGELDIFFQQEEADKQAELFNYIASDEYQEMLQAKGARRLRWPEWLLQTIRHLEPEEYDFLKNHTRYSEEIINSVPSLRALCPVIRAHHERWDGRGGPDSLTGERIPLAARIIAVCDAFDALIQRRPGSKTYRAYDACEIIKGGSGSAFDPQVVEALMRIMAKAREF